MPAAGDRPAVASLCDDSSFEAQRAAALRLAEAVDAIVRERLAQASMSLVPRRSGRRSVEAAWLQSLTATDPWLPGSHDVDKLRALEAEVARWVGSGAAALGSVRVCLRVHEPEHAKGDWPIELLVQDTVEASLVVPAIELWRGRAPFGPNALEEVLAGLGRLARLAPSLGSLLDHAEPAEACLSSAALVDLVANRSATLTEAGIGVFLPAWWSRRGRLGLRVKTKRSAKSGNGSVVAAGVGMDAVVDFSLEAALGDRRLSAAEMRALERAAQAKQALVRVRGEWVQVDPDEIAAIVAHAGTSGRGTVAEIMRAGLGLDRLDIPDGIAVTGVEATGWLGELLDGALHATVTPISTPADFVGTLRPYQERGVGWLAFLGRLGLGACLADDMGLGKTAQLIATLLTEPTEGPTLVVCPVSVLGNWQRELERFAPHLRVIAHHGPDRFRAHRAKLASRAKRADVVLTTYSLVSRDQRELDKVTWVRLVLDEAQQVKNPSAAQTRAVQRIAASRRVALTGTPVENRLSELWSIMHILNPGLLGTNRGFRERFAIPIEREQDPDAAERLRRITAPFVLRRLKTDKTIIDDLPEKIETTEHCPLTAEQATLYQAVVDDLLERSAEADGIGRRGLVLAGIMRLKQVCNHPAHFLRDGSALAGRSGKLTRAEELLDEILSAGDKVLCFTQFAEWGELLAPYWRRRFGVDVGWLHGGVTRPKRDGLVRDFQADPRAGVLLISLKAGGTGLNLTAATHVVHLDRWWNPAVEDQATDRAYRIGQRRSVQVHKLVSTGTVEERIDAMITSKRALAEKVVGNGEAWITELSTDDLRAVIALSAPAENA